MDAKEAKELLSKVPSENFIIDKFTDGIGKCCAIGHLIRLKSENPNDYSRENCNEKHFTIGCEISNFTRDNVADFMDNKYEIFADLADINNEPEYNGYKQSDPKSRVIALLNDMIKAGY